MFVDKKEYNSKVEDKNKTNSKNNIKNKLLNLNDVNSIPNISYNHIKNMNIINNIVEPLEKYSYEIDKQELNT